MPMRSRIKSCTLAIVSMCGLLLFVVSGPSVHAQDLTNRSVTVLSAQPSATTRHTFRFTYNTIATLGSVVLDYCENSPLLSYPCNAPAGLDVSSATLSAQTGNVGFSIDGVNSTANKLVLTRVPVGALSTPSSYTFDNIVNPSTASTTEYVRITTHATADGSGPYTDNGTVAFATSIGFSVGAFVPPFLRFCVGLTVAPDCSSTSGDSIDLGTLSASHASSAQSQFSTGTNDSSGYVIHILGTTMTSGNNIITPIGSPAPSFPGNSQFGINLRANISPQVGEESSGVGTGVPTANYGTPNFYMFQNGDAIASSNLPSDFNRMTTSYVVNVKGDQPPGVYSTTLTYVATVQF